LLNTIKVQSSVVLLIKSASKKGAIPLDTLLKLKELLLNTNLNLFSKSFT